MSVFFLEELFEELNKSKINYCVLRGYEDLPEVVINDVDFGIAPDDKIEFFSILKDLSIRFGYRINIDLIRYCVIKMQLVNKNGEFLKIDVWWQFNFVGFKYINIEELLASRQVYKNIISVPSSEYEFALSFLKELLHNSWIREDKLEILKLKMYSYKPFQTIFTKDIVNDFYFAVNDNQLLVKKLSIRAKLNLVFNNFRNDGLIIVFKNVFSFFKIKYYYNGEYDYLFK